jgi:hypothetical protein
MANVTPEPARTSTYTQTGPYHCKLSFAKYSRPKPFDESKFETTKVIMLPLPLELMDTTSADYNTTSLETVGDILNGNIASGVAAFGLRQAGGVISEAGGAGLGALTQMLSGSSEMGDKVSGAAQKILDPERVNSAIQASLGIAPNPNQTVTFQGPKLREFSFSWTFYPESAIESQNIKNAIAEIRKRSLPFSVRGRSSGVLGYPEMVLMNFYPWDNGTAIHNNAYGWTNNSIIRMKRCVIDRVAVNYAPNNVPAFFQGTMLPVAIRLEISLRELEYMMSEDYMEGGVGGDEANAARSTRSLEFFGATVVGGAVVGGGIAGLPGGLVGAGAGALLAGGDLLFGNDTTNDSLDALSRSQGQPQPASPGGTAQPVQPQATPNPVQEAVAQPNGGR